MLDVRRLRVLREVARQRSFSAAATALGYTQPAISRQIAVLEAEVGVQLLRRLPQGVALTDAGRLLVERAEEILSNLEALEDELRVQAGLGGGTLRLAAFASAAASVVPLALVEYRARYPGVALSVAVADPADSLPLLRAGELDIALSNQADDRGIEGPGRRQDPGGPLEFVPLFEDPMYVALPVDHPLAHAPELDLGALAGEAWMLPTTVTCPDAYLFQQACSAADFTPQIAFQYDDHAALLGFVAAGVGVAVIPDMVARTVREDVVIRALDPPLPPRPVAAVLPAGYRSPAAAAMLEILLELAPSWTAERIEAAVRAPRRTLAEASPA